MTTIINAALGTALVPFEDLPVDTTAAVGDLEFSGRYVPAARGVEPVAGDFFDVLRLGQDLVALYVGDVSGHGTRAVHRMRQLRAAARAYAIERVGPATLLARLDRFVDQLETDHIATLWYGEYVPSTGTLVYSGAGHLPPVLYATDCGAHPLAQASAPPLGTGAAAQHAEETTVHLPVGAALVVYSDGLVERQHTDIDEQIALLCGLVVEACSPPLHLSPDAIAEHVLDALVPERAEAGDDVCVLVARRSTRQSS